MTNKKIELQINGQTLRGIIENTESHKLIILVPGFTGNSQGPDNIFIKLSKKLQHLQYAVLRFDFRGTPTSDGEFQDMTVASETFDLDSIIAYAHNLNYKEIALLGESMGGTIALNAYNDSIKLMILWYTAFNFGDTDFREFLTRKAQEKLNRDGYVKLKSFKVGKKFIEQIPQIDVYNTLSRISCPTLLVHGDNDMDVPYQQSIKAFDMLKSQKELHIIKGAGHCFKQEQDEAIKITTEFIKKYF